MQCSVVCAVMCCMPRDVLCSTAQYCYAIYYTALLNTVLYCAILHCTVLYCTVLHYTTLYCTTLHYTILHCASHLHLVESLNLTLPHHCVVNAQHIVLRLAASGQSEQGKGRKQSDDRLILLMTSIVLCCICVVLYCIIVYCIALFCCTAIYCTVSHCMAWRHVIRTCICSLQQPRLHWSQFEPVSDTYDVT